ncbi:MAG: ABC transporter substrate-binding protein [Deltaproteobacteria bacterium]|nr:ABC transporter substrate-binding protein [Deltaproteobacteria bacterium]
MKKSTLFVWFILLTFILISPASVCKAAEPYKIGAVFSVTGRTSFLGEPERNSAKMFEEQINAAGGINGHPVEIIIYDTEGDATKAKNRIERLIKKDKVLAIVGPSLSGTTLAVIPVIEKAQIPFISCAASIKIVQPVKKWVFKTPQTDTQAAEAIYLHMKKTGLTRAALLTANTGFGASGRVQLKKLAPKMGINIVADEVFGPKDTSMTAQLTKIRGTDAQAIIGWTVGPTQVIMIKNWKQLGMDKKFRFYESHGFGSKRNIELAGGAAEGVYAPLGRVVVAEILPPDHPQRNFVLKYKTDYEKQFKAEVSTFGGHAWDALQMLAMALKAVGPDKAKIRDYLENIKGFAGTGGVFNMSPQDHCGLDASAFEMIVVKDGKWALAE